MFSCRTNNLASFDVLSRQFDDAFKSLLSPEAPVRTVSIGGRAFPAINAWEDEKSVYVEAELPGVKMENIEVSFENSELTLKGKREIVLPEGAERVHSERLAGEFSRTIRFSTRVDASAVEASLKDGVLTITLPKAPESRPRKITVNARNN